MADNRLQTATPAAPAKPKKGYVPAAQRKPPGETTVMNRVIRMLEKLSEQQRAGVVAWLTHRYTVG